MESQSNWRRDHFLFDVHHGPKSWQRRSGSSNVHDLLMSPSSQQAIDLISNDHGLIYHNPPFSSLNTQNTIRSASWRPSTRFLPFRSHYDSGSSMYQGNEFDPFGNKEADLGHVFGGELNECYQAHLSTVMYPAIRPQLSSPRRENRLSPLEPLAKLKTLEKRESSSDLSDDNYSHKRTRF